MIGILRRLRNGLSHYGWNLAYGEYNDDILQHGIQWNKLHFIKNPYKDKWFADPFILQVSDSHIIFLVEEFDSNVQRGRIAKLVVNRVNDTIEDCKILLDLSTHLSFPVIYHDDNCIYIHPENSESGKSTMYLYDLDTDRVLDSVVVSELPLVDAIIRKDGATYKMYATKVPDAGGTCLLVLESDKLTGPFVHVETVSYDRREARMAGAFIESKYGTIRPAQDCNRDYGEAVLFYKGKDVLYRQKPGEWRYEGLHTFNVKDGFFVIDLKIYDHPLMHQLLKTAKSLLLHK